MAALSGALTQNSAARTEPYLEKAAILRVRCNDVLNGGVPLSRERLLFLALRFDSTSIFNRRT
jgi:hypothetical protein